MTAPAVEAPAPGWQSLTYADLRRVFSRAVREQRGEWAGCPIPIEGLGLVVESKSPFADVATYAAQQQHDGVATMYSRGDISDEEAAAPIHVINSWPHTTLPMHVILFRHGEHGPVRHGFTTNRRSDLMLEMLYKSLRASDVHDVTAEHAALQQFAQHVSHAQMRHYLLLGYFTETSKRSGVTYMFRRCRPTIAYRFDNRENRVRFLAALCQHPVAFYDGTFVGAMTPTDDVIAHLLMCRADEHLFWRRSNQHNINSIPAAF